MAKASTVGSLRSVNLKTETISQMVRMPSPRTIRRRNRRFSNLTIRHRAAIHPRVENLTDVYIRLQGWRDLLSRHVGLFGRYRRHSGHSASVEKHIDVTRLTQSGHPQAKHHAAQQTAARCAILLIPGTGYRDSIQNDSGLAQGPAACSAAG